MLGICGCVMIIASAVGIFVLSEWSKGKMDSLKARRVGKPALTTALLSFCFTVLAWAADMHLVRHGQFWGFLVLMLGCLGLAASWRLNARSESLAQQEERTELMGNIAILTSRRTSKAQTAATIVLKAIVIKLVPHGARMRLRRLIRTAMPPRPLPSDLWRAAGTAFGLTSILAVCGSSVLMYLPG